MHLIDILSTISIMKRKRKNNELALNIGKRIKFLVKKAEMNNTKFAKHIGVKPNTIWAYINGSITPSIEVLVKIAEFTKTNIDWIIQGNNSEIPKNDFEKEFLLTIREAKKEGVAEDGKKYLKFIIEEKKKEKTNSTVESKTFKSG